MINHSIILSITFYSNWNKQYVNVIICKYNPKLIKHVKEIKAKIKQFMLLMTILCSGREREREEIEFKEVSSIINSFVL